MSSNINFTNFDISLAMNNQTNNQDLLLLNVIDHTCEVLTFPELNKIKFPGLCRISEKEFLIFGGISGSNFSKSTYRLNIETKAIQKMADLPNAISRPKAIYFDNKVYSFGGKNSDTNFSSECYNFDPVTQIWSRLSDIPYTYTQILSIFGYEDIICLTLNGSKFICFDPNNDQWFFWKLLFYSFDKVCTHNNKLFLINDNLKVIYEYDIKNDLIETATMIDFDYDEFISFNGFHSIVYLNHSLDQFYFVEIDFENLSFKKYEKEIYDSFFASYVLIINNPNQYIYPKMKVANKSTNCFDIKIQENKKDQNGKNENPGLSKTGFYSHVFGGHATPFHLEIDWETFAVTPHAIPSRLELKNMQGVTRLDNTDSELIFAGGSRQDSETIGSIDAFRYNVKSNNVNRIQELNSKSKISWLTKVNTDIYILNETPFFQRYDLLKNQWFDMKPCFDDFFYNNFVYKNQLFIFISAKNDNDGYDFIVLRYNKASNDWTSNKLKDVSFIITADFSYAIDGNKYLVIGHPLNSQPNTIPYIYELSINSASDQNFEISVRQVCKLTPQNTKSVRILPLAYQKKLLFCLVDLSDQPFSVIYDISKEAPGISDELSKVYTNLRSYLTKIKFDFRLADNINIIA